MVSADIIYDEYFSKAINNQDKTMSKRSLQRLASGSHTGDGSCFSLGAAFCWGAIFAMITQVLSKILSKKI